MKIYCRAREIKNESYPHKVHKGNPRVICSAIQLQYGFEIEDGKTNLFGIEVSDDMKYVFYRHHGEPHRFKICEYSRKPIKRKQNKYKEMKILLDTINQINSKIDELLNTRR